MWILGLKWLITVQFSLLRRGSRWVSQQKWQSCNTNSPLRRREGLVRHGLLRVTHLFLFAPHSLALRMYYGGIYSFARGGGGGYSWEFLLGVCRSVLQILTLFQTKKCHFSHPFSDLASKIHIRFQTCRRSQNATCLFTKTEINYIII